MDSLTELEELEDERGDTTTALPAEWNRQALDRLAFLSGVAVVLGLLLVGLAQLRQPNLGLRAGLERPTWVLHAGLGLSAVMFAAARWRRLPAEVRIDLGLVYLVGVCLLMGFFRHGLPYAASDVLRGVSPVVPAILVFAVLVPMRPTRLAGAAALAAGMDPLALLLLIEDGAPNPPWNLWLWLFAPNVLTVGLAWAASRVLYTLGQSLTRAREMGSYQLQERLGAGGMGEVWRARHRLLARPAAIKFVRPELFASGTRSAESILRRFEREAQATAMLDSPHTVELYDYGVAKDGTFYIVMELLDGMDLLQLLERTGPLPAPRTVHLLRQVCHSLRDAHASGVIHRDIKPANVFVCRKGEEFDFVKVLDFGIARCIELQGDAGGITAEGAVAGTPAAMPPEAIRGAEVDGRSDIYSFGCMAYRMLSGRDVFPLGRGVPALFAAHLEDLPEPLSETAPPGIPPALEALVMRCLEKDRAARPRNVAELLVTLEAIAATLEVWDSGRARAWWQDVPAPPGSVADAATLDTLAPGRASPA